MIVFLKKFFSFIFFFSVIFLSIKLQFNSQSLKLSLDYENEDDFAQVISELNKWIEKLEKKYWEENKGKEIKVLNGEELFKEFKKIYEEKYAKEEL